MSHEVYIASDFTSSYLILNEPCLGSFLPAFHHGIAHGFFPLNEILAQEFQNLCAPRHTDYPFPG